VLTSCRRDVTLTYSHMTKLLKDGMRVLVLQPVQAAITEGAYLTLLTHLTVTSLSVVVLGTHIIQCVANRLL
jgi:hypothetical protein